MEKINTYVCRRIRLFEALTKAGFVPYNSRQDRDHSQYIVWLFIDTPELREEVERFYTKIN